MKGRERGKPFSVIVADIDMALSLTEGVSDLALKLMDEFWPGPLTLLVPARKDLSVLVAGEKGKIGMRVSSHPLAAEIVKELATALTATSANRAGGKSPVRVEDVMEDFAGRVDLILDGGELSGQYGSTVLDVTVSPPEFVREGECDVQKVQQVIQHYGGE